MSELKPCPFCGCSMRLESNRDWHRVMGDHTEECVFMDSETMMVPASDEQRDLAVADWNKRAIQDDQVLVPRDLLERIFHGDLLKAPAAIDELRNLLHP